MRYGNVCNDYGWHANYVGMGMGEEDPVMMYISFVWGAFSSVCTCVRVSVRL